ncbi:hypothetical protein COTS27_00090 [Spirochaetota bacterium]|nr:hypothetical protein COTS27_00090 [Spirochaetota bacterium]
MTLDINTALPSNIRKNVFRITIIVRITVLVGLVVIFTSSQSILIDLPAQNIINPTVTNKITQFNTEPPSRRIRSSFLNEELAVIRNKIDYHDLEEALSRTLRLKNQYAENLAIRELLFEVYLKKGLFEKSEIELTFIRTRRNDSQTRYLTAQLELAKATQNSYLTLSLMRGTGILAYTKEERTQLLASISLASELIAEDARFFKAHLLLCKAFILIGNTLAAQKHSTAYKNLSGKDKQWFDCEIHLQLLEKPLPQKTLRSLLREYLATFERDANFSALEALFYRRTGNYNDALKAINNALYFNANQREYIAEKIDLLYATKNYSDLITFLKNHPGTTREERARRLYIEALAYFLTYKQSTELRPAKKAYPPHSARTYNRKTLSHWTFNKKAKPEANLYNKLAAVLTYDNENEIPRYFYETLVAHNTRFTHPVRETLAAYHLNQATTRLNQGNINVARAYYLRAISLAPQDSTVREAYLDFLITNKLLRAYEEELNIITTLKNEDPAEQDYKSKTRLELVKKATRGDLENRYNITRDEHLREGIRLLVVTPPPVNFAHQTPTFFYLTALIEAMLESTLETSYYFTPTFTSTHHLEQALGNEDYDYVLAYTITDNPKNLKFTYTVTNVNSRNIIKEGDIIVKNKSRLLPAFQKWQQTLERSMKRRGRILRITDNKLILSLGKRQILEPLTENPTFYVEKNQIGAPPTLLGPFPIKQIEERVSLGEVRDYFTLANIKLGEAIIMSPLVETLP